MNKKLNWIAMGLVVVAALMSKGCHSKTEEEAPRSVYHWKTVYAPSPYEENWMKEHRVDRLYLKMFDVDCLDDGNSSAIVPIATTKFAQPVPAGVEVVPVVYVTMRAMREMNYSWGDEKAIGHRIIERVDAMMKCHGMEYSELQIDCDHAANEMDVFDNLCRSMKEELARDGRRLSSTLRLWMVDRLNPYVDSWTLMLYNTGRMQAYDTQNSILSYDDVKPYLNRLAKAKSHEVEVAWPVYAWGVAFDDDNRFSHLVNSADTSALCTNVREEMGDPAEIGKVKRAVKSRLGKKQRGVALFHLDSLNLSKYTYDEIESIYNY